MQTNSISQIRAAELDADNPAERLLLSKEPGQKTRELWFFPESNDGHYWRIVEVTEWGEGRERVVRFLDLKQNAVLPLGAIQAGTQNGWDVNIVYAKGETSGRGQMSYKLRDCDEAHKLQRLVAGYRHCGSFKSVTCHVISKSKKLLALRDEQDIGEGEIQLWEWPILTTTESTPGTYTQPSSRSPAQAASLASTVETVSGTSGGISLQKTGGRELVLSSIAPPPVLVFYAEYRKLYKMMKVESK